MVQSDLKKWTGETLNKYESFLRLLWKYDRKIATIFREVTCCSNFSNVSLHFPQHTFLFDILIDFEKRLQEDAYKVLEKSLMKLVK